MREKGSSRRHFYGPVVSGANRRRPDSRRLVTPLVRVAHLLRQRVERRLWRRLVVRAVCPHTPNHQQVRRVITPHIDLSHRLRRRVPEENRSSASRA